jgi:hypothetical protein
VGRMELHRIEPRRPGAYRCGPEGVDGFPDLFQGHFPGDAEVWETVAANGRRPDGLAGLEEQDVFPSRVVELHGDPAALVMDDIGQPAQPRDIPVVPDRPGLGRCGPQRMHLRDLRDDEPGPALGPAPHVGQVGLADGAVLVAQPRPHGRHDESVAKFQGFDANGRQQVFQGLHCVTILLDKRLDLHP